MHVDSYIAPSRSRETDEMKEKSNWYMLLLLLFSSALLFYMLFNGYFTTNNNNPLRFQSIPLKLRLPSTTCDENPHHPTTNVSHLLFGLLGSVQAWPERKAYIESWWRPNSTRGFIFLDHPPSAENHLLPWSGASPFYRVSQDLILFLRQTHAKAPVMIRMVHAILEIFREPQPYDDFRWLVMGDDDSILFVDNIVDLLAQYDHTKYYYLGGQSEFILSNYWFSFNQGFGGAGFMLSYPLAKSLADDMENCLRRYAHINSADLITMSCISDVGVNLSPHQGIHQIDLHGDISGFLSAHPQAPLISLHHFDVIEPIFPSKNRSESARHLMRAADTFGQQQSRMLQQTICYHHHHHQGQNNWSFTFSVSWGYSVHVYEKIMPRRWLQLPIETFKPWIPNNRDPPHYMFNTRGPPSKDPCEAPHVFYFESIKKIVVTDNEDEEKIQTVYSRASPRGLPACSSFNNANNTKSAADYISTIEVISPATKRIETGRCECCDVVHEAKMDTARVIFRQCRTDEIIA